jgi:hypothetical protein
MASAVPDGPSDAGLVAAALGGDVVSSAAITVIESEFVNPPDDPQHCPPAVTQVLFHDGTDQVRRSLGYFQPHPKRED